MIYLDNAATTLDRTSHLDLSCISYGNPNSAHNAGWKAKETIREAEKIILDFINGHNGRLLWTGSGSQANQLALNTICKIHNCLITSKIEHKSILEERRFFGLVDCNENGIIKEEDVTRMSHQRRSEKHIVSVQMINNETGVEQPIEKIKYILCTGAILHVDAVQALGKIPIDVEDLGIDMLTISAHKVYGPKGLGTLWVRNSVEKNYKFPYLGTPPTELIYRFASTIKKMDMQKDMEKIIKLENYLLHCLELNKIKYNLNATYKRVPGIYSISIDNIDALDLALYLSDKDIYVSTGSACNSNNTKLSYVLKAMNISEQRIRETIRISIGITNSERDIDILVKEIKNYIETTNQS